MGTDAEDVFHDATAVVSDGEDNESGAIVLAGSTRGEWSGKNKGERDFAAVKLSSDDGTELWRWQVCMSILG